MQLVNKFFLFLAAPFLGLFIVLGLFLANQNALLFPVAEMNVLANTIEEDFACVREDLGLISDLAAEQITDLVAIHGSIVELVKKAEDQKELSEQIYEDRILAMLGPAIHTHRSKRVEVKVFELKELGYRGYIAKLKLFDPSVFKVVLAKDKLGEKETTLDAAERTGAILAINGGGFYTEMRDGKPYGIHIGNLVIDGKIIGSFNPYPPDLHFVGINRQGRVIGGVYHELDQFKAINPWQGVSFVPILIKGGMVRPIPPEWAKTKQPRTIMGEYANGDLIMIVVDGRQSNWSSGVALENLLDKLVELGVKEAYNLDGGGSSAFVYKDQVLNKPSDGKPRPVVTNIVVMP